MTLAPRTVLFLPRYAPPCELRNIPRLRRVSRRGISTAVPAAYPVKHPMLVRAGRSGLHARVSIERSRPVLREFVRKLAATRSSAAGVSGDSKLAEVARPGRMEVICSASGAAVECRSPANRQATNRPHYVIDGSHVPGLGRVMDGSPFETDQPALAPAVVSSGRSVARLIRRKCWNGAWQSCLSRKLRKRL